MKSQSLGPRGALWLFTGRIKIDLISKVLPPPPRALQSLGQPQWKFGNSSSPGINLSSTKAWRAPLPLEHRIPCKIPAWFVLERTRNPSSAPSPSNSEYFVNNQFIMSLFGVGCFFFKFYFYFLMECGIFFSIFSFPCKGVGRKSSRKGEPLKRELKLKRTFWCFLGASRISSGVVLFAERKI